MIQPNKSIKSLLVADDDLDDLMLLLSAIQSLRTDVKVCHVRDGGELFSFLKSESIPDLILLDINMPKIDGMDCLKRIKSQPEYNNIPIVMHSTSSNNEIIDRCYQYGASRYIVKPIFYRDIVGFMKMLLAMDWNRARMVSRDEFILSS